MNSNLGRTMSVRLGSKGNCDLAMSPARHAVAAVVRLRKISRVCPLDLDLTNVEGCRAQVIQRDWNWNTRGADLLIPEVNAAR